MTFKRPATERQLSFADIAKTTRLHEDQVEILVMKAIAKGLVDGTIDEVAKTVHLTRVQPRVLNRQQVGHSFSSSSNCVIKYCGLVVIVIITWDVFAPDWNYDFTT